MKNIKRPVLWIILGIFWSMSCVTLFPNSARDVSTPTELSEIAPPAGVPETAAPVNTNLTGQIVYTKGDDIYTINANGTNETRLATGTLPTWSPDGGKILFLVDPEADDIYEIHTMHADGTNDTRLAIGNWPVWSSDGNTIAFLADPEGDFDNDIFLINADGTNLRPLISNQNEYSDPRDLKWQPNGSLIVFVALSRKDRDVGYDVFIADVNSASLKQVPRQRADVWDTAWSPDGSQIIFVSSEDPNDTGTLYTVHADGTGEQKVAHIGTCWRPTFSPDAQWISCVANGIRLMNADGSDQRSVLDKKTWSFHTWSPDGKYILVTVKEEEITRLYIVSLDGTVTYLTEGGNGDWKP